MKLFDPIGLGSLKGKAFLDISENGIERRRFTEADVAKPCQGELWIEFELLYGHFNGPKKRYLIITNGDIVRNAYNNHTDRYGSTIDIGLIKFVKRKLNELFNGSDGMALGDELHC